MEYKILGNGVKMPMLGLGTFKINDPEICADSVREAISIGYRLIDTAQCYWNEEYVGKGIAASGVSREDLFITTKVWFKYHDRAYVSVLESMEKLRTDYLDLVLIHWPFADTYKAWRDLEMLYHEGRIRAIGVSNYNADRLVDLISYNEVAPVINQIETNLVCQQRTNRAWMDKLGVAHESYAPFGQGRVDEIYERESILAIAAKYGKTPRQITLRFLIQEGTVVIPKSTHTDRLRENLEVFDFALEPEEMQVLRGFDTGKPLVGTPDNPEKVERLAKEQAPSGK